MRALASRPACVLSRSMTDLFATLPIARCVWPRDLETAASNFASAHSSVTPPGPMPSLASGASCDRMTLSSARKATNASATHEKAAIARSRSAAFDKSFALPRKFREPTPSMRRLLSEGRTVWDTVLRIGDVPERGQCQAQRVSGVGAHETPHRLSTLEAEAALGGRRSAPVGVREVPSAACGELHEVDDAEHDQAEDREDDSPRR